MDNNVKLPKDLLDWLMKYDEVRRIPDIKYFHERIFTEFGKMLVETFSNVEYREIYKLLENGWAFTLSSNRLFPKKEFSKKYAKALFSEVATINPQWMLTWVDISYTTSEDENNPKVSEEDFGISISPVKKEEKK